MASAERGTAISILLDTNVVLDLLLRREPWLSQAQPLWDSRDAGRVVVYLPTVALTNIFYIGRKQIGNAQAFEGIRFCLANFILVAVDRVIAEHALTLSGNDFEGNVQIACAVQAGVDFIVTRDPNGFAHSPIRAVSPPDLNKHLPTR